MDLKLLEKVSKVIENIIHTNFFQKQFKFILLDIIYKQIVDKIFNKNFLA